MVGRWEFSILRSTPRQKTVAVSVCNNIRRGLLTCPKVGLAVSLIGQLGAATLLRVRISCSSIDRRQKIHNKRAPRVRNGHEEVALRQTMASLRPAFAHLSGRCRTSAPQCQQLRHMLQGLHISPKARHTRPLSTVPPGPNDALFKDEIAHQEAEVIGRVSEPISDSSETEYSVSEQRSEGHEQAHEHPQLVNRPQWADRFQQGGQGPSANGVSGRGDFDRGSNKGEASFEVYRSNVHARAMPVSPSYFSRQPEFNDSYLLLQKMMRKYAHLPTVPSDQLERVAFRSLKDYRLAVGEEVKASEFARCMTLVKRLNKIHPKLAPPNIKGAIAPFTRDINPHIHKAKDIPVDKFGRTLGVGKRKTSVARAWVVEGVGEVLVNGKSLADAFGRVHDRESAVWALKATARTDKYNVWAIVEGGGTTGQAEALAMAVGKALMAHEPALKPALRRGEWTFSNGLYDSDTNALCSWCCDSRSQRCGKEEAWSPQGKEETRLGQALRSVWLMWYLMWFYCYLLHVQQLLCTKSFTLPVPALMSMPNWHPRLFDASEVIEGETSVPFDPSISGNRALTLGKDVSALFPDVMKNIAKGDLDQKKLVYLYFDVSCSVAMPR